MARRRKKKMTLGRFFLMLILVILVATAMFIYENYIKEKAPSHDIPEANGQLQVYFIDIGQADATLIIAPTGEKMLIDAGKAQHPSYGVDADDYFREREITTLDYLVITHYDYDHIGSGKNILEQCEVKNILAYDYEPTSKTGKDLQAAFDKEEGATLLSPDKGHTFTMGSVFFEVLSEEITEENRDKNNENDNSICLMMTYGDVKFLFTGDGEEDREEELIKNYGSKLDADVFQAGHHGARNANTKAFLDLVTPDYTVFSCGEGNKYNHPTNEALDHTDDHSEHILRTDKHGTVVFKTDGKTLSYEIEKGEKPAAAVTWGLPLGWLAVPDNRRFALPYAA